MTSDMDEAMEAEFDTVAEWTAQVAVYLGPDYFIPAGCRGSGQPSALDWLLEGLRPRAGELMIDVGAGVGGPSAYAAGRTGVRPVLVEPEPGASRAAARLFHALVVQADARALPFLTPRPTWCGPWACSVRQTARGPNSPCCGRCTGWRAQAGGSGCSSTWPPRQSWTIRRRETTSRPAAS